MSDKMNSDCENSLSTSMSTSNSFQYLQHVKLVFLGSVAVGKTCLIGKYQNTEFDLQTSPTIGVAFGRTTFTIGNEIIILEMWDTAGLERFRSLAPMYYRNAKIAVVVYAINDRNSFNSALDWLNEVRYQRDPPAIIALVGNKMDLAGERKIEYDEAKTIAKDMGLLFMETSAKTGDNVDKLFRRLARRFVYYDKAQSESYHQNIDITSSFHVSHETKEEKASKREKRLRTTCPVCTII